MHKGVEYETTETEHWNEEMKARRVQELFRLRLASHDADTAAPEVRSTVEPELLGAGSIPCR